VARDRESVLDAGRPRERLLFDDPVVAVQEHGGAGAPVALVEVAIELLLGIVVEHRQADRVVAAGARHLFDQDGRGDAEVVEREATGRR